MAAKAKMWDGGQAGGGAWDGMGWAVVGGQETV
jgi:hypothetical protein